MYGFPTDEDARAKWVLFCNRPHHQAPNPSKAKVCALHFAPSCFKEASAKPGARTRLKKGSIPTIHPGQEGKSPEAAALIAPVAKPARKPPKDRRGPDQLPQFLRENEIRSLDDIKQQKIPPRLHIVSHDDCKVIYDFRTRGSHDVPEVRGAVKVLPDLSVLLYYRSLPVPRPEFIRSANPG
jgi:hypothetical protein